MKQKIDILFLKFGKKSSIFGDFLDASVTIGSCAEIKINKETRIRIARKETKNMKYFVKLVKEYQIEHSNEFDSLEIKCFDETSTKKSVKRPAVAIVIEENEGD